MRFREDIFVREKERILINHSINRLDIRLF